MSNTLPHAVSRWFLFLLAIGLLAAPTQAQEVRKALNDYVRERPFQYQPSDPWVRSKLFQIQTKHYGWFYNCDNQECKRNSPYICWKTHHDRDLPSLMTCRERIRHEWCQVKQRILDGAGMCAASCGCAQCQQGDVYVEPHGTMEPIQGWVAGKDQVKSKAKLAQQTQTSATPVARATEGLIVGGQSNAQRKTQVKAGNVESQPVRVAEQPSTGAKLLDRLRSIQR